MAAFGLRSESRHVKSNVQKQSSGGVLRYFAKFTGKHLCQSLFFNKVAGLSNLCFPVNFAKLVQEFSREFYEITQTFFYRTPLVAASELTMLLLKILLMSVSKKLILAKKRKLKIRFIYF